MISDGIFSDDEIMWPITTKTRSQGQKVAEELVALFRPK